MSEPTPPNEHAKANLKVLLLEGIADTATDAFKDAGFHAVENRAAGLDEDDLIEALDGVHVLGVRSRSKVTKKVLSKAKSLLSVGCFSVGTNQVALEEARLRGVPVFNAPFSNTRSVAELTIAEIIMLYRRILPRAMAANAGGWHKSAIGSHEVRDKTLGIVGYGNVGSQLAVLAEALNMHVVFFDIADKLRHGSSRSLGSLDELLAVSDVVSLHVPQTPETQGMIGARELSLMKHGAFLINNSRGKVVDIDALRDALVASHLAGAAVDVFPSEPSSSKERFASPLQNLDNVILTPHIGGSTGEAQDRIGQEVARKLVGFLDAGSTHGAVNFPELMLARDRGSLRFVHIHVPAPGVLRRISESFDRAGARIVAQHFHTDGKIGYAVIDAEGVTPALIEDMQRQPSTLRTRIVEPDVVAKPPAAAAPEASEGRAVA